ncbi:MAG: DUF2442 domain-containing protein [Burkholderiales bacterium]|nr:DUF2442 domain-containing protein [Burkholderiales bacterium]
MDWDVNSVKVLPNHRLAVELADGRKGIFDLHPFLDRPGLQRLKNPAYFASVGIRFGALTWPHEEDIAPDTLSAHLELVAIA